VSKRSKRLTFFACVLAWAAWALWPVSPERARANNEAYLERIARILCAFRARHGHVPESIEAALADSGQKLPNRGDYYGGTLWHVPAGDSAFFLRTSNVELCYADCRRVSREEFVAWVRSHPDSKIDPADWLQVYGFLPSSKNWQGWSRGR
jgi:hypothetical protein